MPGLEKQGCPSGTVTETVASRTRIKDLCGLRFTLLEPREPTGETAQAAKEILGVGGGKNAMQRWIQESKAKTYPIFA